MVNLCWQILFQTTCKHHISNGVSQNVPKTINSIQRNKSFENLKNVLKKVKSKIFS